jgi:hypothetical protein
MSEGTFPPSYRAPAEQGKLDAHRWRSGRVSQELRKLLEQEETERAEANTSGPLIPMIIIKTRVASSAEPLPRCP